LARREAGETVPLWSAAAGCVAPSPCGLVCMGLNVLWRLRRCGEEGRCWWEGEVGRIMGGTAGDVVAATLVEQLLCRRIFVLLCDREMAGLCAAGPTCG